MNREGVGAISPNYTYPMASSSYHMNDDEENYPIFDPINTKNDGDQKETSRTLRKKHDRTPEKEKDDLLCAGWASQESPFLKRRKRAGSLDTESLSEDHSVSTQENSESHNEFSTDLNGCWIASVPPSEEDNLMKSEDEVGKAPDESYLPSVVESSLFVGQSTSKDEEEERMTEDLSPVVSKIKGKVETQSDFDRLFLGSNTKELFQQEHDKIEKPFICPIHGACPADPSPSLFEDVSSPQKLVCEYTNCRLSKVFSIVNMDQMGSNSPSDYLKRNPKLSLMKRKMDRNAQFHPSDLNKMGYREHYRPRSKPHYSKSLISSKKPSVSRKLIGCENNYIRRNDDDSIFPDQPASTLVECHMLDDDHVFHFQVPPHEIGFCNLGNTCFVNSTLQVLLALPGFVKSLHENCEGRMDLPTAILQLDEIAESRKSGDGLLVQKNLRNFISDLWQLNEVYSNGDQHDANEFLLRLMAIIKTSLPNGPIEKFFEFDMVEIHECLKCGEITRRVRHESNLCLPIGSDSHYIEQCLESYLEDEERSITCDRCQERATKVSNKFLSFPRNLVLTLNRYSKEEKIMQFISPPDKIDLRKFLEEPEKYQEETKFTLVGKITHLGHSKFSGHYICDVLCEDGSWRSYNDEHVSSIPLKCEAESLDDPAYIFFFTRQESSVPFPEVEQ